MNYLLEQYETQKIMKTVFFSTEEFETVPSIGECLSVTACLMRVLTEGTVDSRSGNDQWMLQYNTIEAIYICYLQLSLYTIRLLQ
jgi:ABC-type phosphate/phosphonate transport system ATPase subunit